MSVKQLSRVRWTKESVDAGIAAIKDDTKGPKYLEKYGRDKYSVKEGKLFYGSR